MPAAVAVAYGAKGLSPAPAPVKLGFDFSRARDFNWLFTTDRVRDNKKELTSLEILPERVRRP